VSQFVQNVIGFLDKTQTRPSAMNVLVLSSQKCFVPSAWNTIKGDAGAPRHDRLRIKRL